MLLINNYKAKREVVQVQTHKALALKSFFGEEKLKTIIVYLLSQGFVHCPFCSAIHIGTEAKAIKTGKEMTLKVSCLPVFYALCFSQQNQKIFDLQSCLRLLLSAKV